MRRSKEEDLLERARAGLTLLPADDPTGDVLAQAIYVPPGERYWMSLDAIDWRMRLVPGTPREACVRGLIPTSHRVLVLGPGSIEVLDLVDCEPFAYRRDRQQGFVIAISRGERREFSAHWGAGACVFVELVNQLREARLAGEAESIERFAERLDIPIADWINCPMCGSDLDVRVEHAAQCTSCCALYGDDYWQPEVDQSDDDYGRLVGVSPRPPLVAERVLAGSVRPYMIRPRDWAMGPSTLPDYELERRVRERAGAQQLPPIGRD